jgi:hypothetical protein
MIFHTTSYGIVRFFSPNAIAEMVGHTIRNRSGRCNSFQFVFAKVPAGDIPEQSTPEP